MERTVYQVIHDPIQVMEFINLFIPDQKHHALVFQLFARRKYNAVLSKSEFILNRIIIGGNIMPAMALKSIQKLEIPIGYYTGSNDECIPNDSLALYCLLRPKDMVKAMSKTLTQCINFLSSDDEPRNPMSMYKVEIGKSGYNCKDDKLMQIDLDSKDAVVIHEVKKLFEKINLTVLMTVETRGGYHIIYHKSSDIDYKSLYEYTMKNVVEHIGHDGKKYKDKVFSICNEPNVIVPGTYQGGFKANKVDIF